MKIDVVEMGKDDVMLVRYNIGNLPVQDVDEFCEIAAGFLAEAFGKGKVLLFPVREGDDWDFTIVKRQV